MDRRASYPNFILGLTAREMSQRRTGQTTCNTPGQKERHRQNSVETNRIRRSAGNTNVLRPQMPQPSIYPVAYTESQRQPLCESPISETQSTSPFDISK
jgi:hypothetical protein